MSDTETKSRTGEDVSPVARVSAAMAGLIGDYKALTADLEEKLAKQEERLTMLDHKTALANRPALSTRTEVEAPHLKAFDAYLRSGDDDALRGLDLEGKAMSTAINSDGGFLVDPQTAALIQSKLDSLVSIRAISNVVNVEAAAFDVLIDRNDTGAGWASETSNAAETATPTIERISIPLYELNAMPKVSQRLLDDSAFDVEAWLASRISDKFIRAEASAFISGDGVDKPTGLLNYTLVSNDIWTWGELGYVASGSASDLGDGDALIDLVYSLDARYRPNGTFVMNSKTAGALRKLKDADGRHLWADGLAAAEPARMLGYKVLIAEDMPDIGANEFPVAFGDFGAGYTIAERPDIRVLRDPFSAKPHVLFYASKRVGGGVSDFAAIKFLRCATS